MKTYKLETTLYNPQEKGRQELINDFVIRESEYEQIFLEIEEADYSLPPQNYMIIGQRGMGKTTLMLRIRYAIENSEKIKNKVLPITLKEEHYAIDSLSDLWLQISEFLEDYYDFVGLLDQVENVEFVNEDDYREDVYNVLEKALKEDENSIVVFIDNFNELLEKFSEQDVQFLRSILMNKKYIRLVASNPNEPTELTDYQKPLFEFFKIFHLETLQQSEVIKLLRTLARSNDAEEQIERLIQNHPERINTLRILSGGVPRTITLLFNIFIEEQTQSSIQDLYKLLDDITPLYKHKMDVLKPKQQRIVYAVAMNWDGITVKELVSKTKMESKVISAQLNQLVKNQVIEKVATESKNFIYRLKERFLNIWYLMRLGNRKQHDRVVWLVRFLDAWCSETEMGTRVDFFLSDNAVSDEIKTFLGTTFLASKKVDIERKYEIVRKMERETEFKNSLEIQMGKLVSLIRGNKKFEEICSYIESSKNYQVLQEACFVFSLNFNRYDVVDFLFDEVCHKVYPVIFEDSLCIDSLLNFLVMTLRFDDFVYVVKNCFDGDKAEELLTKATRLKNDFDDANLESEKLGNLLIASNFLEKEINNNSTIYFINKLKDKKSLILLLLFSHRKQRKHYDDIEKEIIKQGGTFLDIGMAFQALNNLEKAIKYLEKSIEEEKASPSYLVSVLLDTNNDTYAVLAANWATKALKTREELDEYEIIRMITALIWNNQIEEGIEQFNEFINENSLKNLLLDSSNREKIWEEVVNLFAELLVKEQYYTVAQYLSDLKLEEMIKPIYYATQYYLGNSDVLNRMGPEIEEVYNEILQYVSDKRAGIAKPAFNRKHQEK